jgi:hypothetical protein
MLGRNDGSVPHSEALELILGLPSCLQVVIQVFGVDLSGVHDMGSLPMPSSCTPVMLPCR